MERKVQISSFQFLSLITVSRLLTTLTFMPITEKRVNTSDFIISMLVSTAFMYILFIPPISFLDRYRDKSILDLCNNSFKKILAVLYSVYFLFYAFFTLSRLNLFVSSVYFENSNTVLFIILSVLGICFCASYGLEALGRAATVSLVVLILALLTIFLPLSNKVNINNLSPLFYDGFSPVLKTSFNTVFRTFEPTALLIIAPKIKGSIKKGILIWFTLIGVVFTFVFFYIMSVLGDSYVLQLFPAHAISEISQFSVMERLDALLSGVWVISAFIKLCFTAYLISETLTSAFNKISKKSVLTFVFVVLSISIFFSSQSILYFADVTLPLLKMILFIIFVLIIPSLVLILNKKRGVNK